MTTYDINQLFAPDTQPEWMSTLLTNAAALQLPTTAWQSGGVTRTTLAIFSYALNFLDSSVSLIAQGGFLDFAATGTVTYTTPNADGTVTTTTVPVTPDPSDPTVNPTGAPGWLDVLANSVYNVKRIWKTYAGGPLAICNTSASTYGPFAVGGYHVSNPNTKATYSNLEKMSVPPSTAVGTSISAIVSSGGLIRVTTSTIHGRTTGDLVFISGGPLAGTAWYITVVDSTKFTLDGSVYAGPYTASGTVYLPTAVLFQADVAGSPSNSLDATGAPATHTVTTPVTSLVGVSVDNPVVFLGSDTERNVALADRCRLKLQSLSPNGPRGAYRWAALSSQQLATTFTPPRSVSQAITRAEVFSDRTTGTVAVWIATATGAPTTPAVTATDAVVQAYAVPLSVTATTAAASQVSVAAVADIWVPAALNTAATKTLFQVALQAYFSVFPIGGVSDPGGSYAHVLPFNDVLGSLFEAGNRAQIPIQQATLTLNGATANIGLAFSAALAEVAVLSPAVPTINLHSY